MTSILSGVVASGKTGHLSQPIQGSFDALATVTVGAGGASSITFTGIPTTYTHLQLRYIGLASGTQYGLQVGNGTVDTGNNYSWHEMSGTGSSANAGYTNNTSQITMNFFTATSTTYPTAGIIDILDYANTNKYKTVRYLDGEDANSSGQITFGSGVWMNTAAITALTINQNWTQYSSFALYGVK